VAAAIDARRPVGHSAQESVGDKGGLTDIGQLDQPRAVAEAAAQV